MERIDKLKKMVDNNAVYFPLIEHMLELEKELDRLKELPHIRVNPNNPELQKTTPAAKQYKEFLQQYLNALKVLGKITGKDNETEDSPLREWLKRQDANL